MTAADNRGPAARAGHRDGPAEEEVARGVGRHQLNRVGAGGRRAKQDRSGGRAQRVAAGHPHRALADHRVAGIQVGGRDLHRAGAQLDQRQAAQSGEVRNQAIDGQVGRRAGRDILHVQRERQAARHHHVDARGQRGGRGAGDRDCGGAEIAHADPIARHLRTIGQDEVVHVVPAVAAIAGRGRLQVAEVQRAAGDVEQPAVPRVEAEGDVQRRAGAHRDGRAVTVAAGGVEGIPAAVQPQATALHNQAAVELAGGGGGAEFLRARANLDDVHGPAPVGHTAPVAARLVTRADEQRGGQHGLIKDAARAAAHRAHGGRRAAVQRERAAHQRDRIVEQRVVHREPQVRVAPPNRHRTGVAVARVGQGNQPGDGQRPAAGERPGQGHIGVHDQPPNHGARTADHHRIGQHRARHVAADRPAIQGQRASAQRGVIVQHQRARPHGDTAREQVGRREGQIGRSILHQAAAVQHRADSGGGQGGDDARAGQREGCAGDHIGPGQHGRQRQMAEADRPAERDEAGRAAGAERGVVGRKACPVGVGCAVPPIGLHIVPCARAILQAGRRGIGIPDKRCGRDRPGQQDGGDGEQATRHEDPR